MSRERVETSKTPMSGGNPLPMNPYFYGKALSPNYLLGGSPSSCGPMVMKGGGMCGGSMCMRGGGPRNVSQKTKQTKPTNQTNKPKKVLPKKVLPQKIKAIRTQVTSTLSTKQPEQHKDHINCNCVRRGGFGCPMCHGR